VIHEFDAALTRLLQVEFGKPLPFDVSFAVPNHEFAPVSSERATLNCYLYEVAEDRALRNLEPFHRPAGGGIVRTERPPARVRLSYCLTAWSPAARDGGRDPALDEHALLGAVMMALLRHPTLPATVLEGGLAGTEPIPTAFIVSEGLKSRDFWNAVGGTLRPALEYTATISMPFERPVTAPMAASITVEVLGGSPLHTIGGIVRTAADPAQAIAGAWVRLSETGETAVTDSSGAFRIARLRGGEYTIAARAVGFREATRTVRVPGGDYDLQLGGV
jgi:hypothetical protein